VRARPSAANPYAKWVSEDVVYIITNDERAAFRRLQSDEERDHFVEQFWLRRDPTPDTPENEFKEEHYRRIAYANEHFASAIPGWKTDRGRIYITYGPPDEKESHLSTTGANSFLASEQWRYHYIEAVGLNVVIEFVQAPGTSEFRMTTDPAVTPALLHVPREMPVTNAATPKAGATVQMKGQGEVLISIPLTAYGDHRVNVYGRVVTKALTYSGPVPPPPPVQVFEASIQAAPIYTHHMTLAQGGGLPVRNRRQGHGHRQARGRHYRLRGEVGVTAPWPAA
jgi:GWxTD domain-containing protein